MRLRTTTQAAEETGVSPALVRRLIDQGRVPVAQRVGYYRLLDDRGIAAIRNREKRPAGSPRNSRKS